ncbi:hypothetical protein N752_01020 [Desulforamulus aquiferis]|nr:hypothetical protein [Desulforamulus aquiferis]RYD07196.1 hypothetical protein N752_01020 [Desulforamulus aquiferis]
MNYISKVLVVVGVSLYLFLINDSVLLAAATIEDVKGGVSEGQTFVESVTGNPGKSEGKLIGSTNSRGTLEIRSIPPEEAANEINGFLGGVYHLVSNISPQALAVALIILLICGPFVSNFLQD